MNNFAIFFSPTKSTEKVTRLLAGEFGSYSEMENAVADQEYKRNYASKALKTILYRY